MARVLYVLSTSLCRYPLLSSSFAILVCAFAIGGWPWDNFITFVFHRHQPVGVRLLGQMLAVLFVNPIICMLAYLGYWSTSIPSGDGVPRRRRRVALRSLYYLMPLKWLFNGVGYDVYYPESSAARRQGIRFRYPGTNLTCTSAGFYCEGARLVSGVGVAPVRRC